MSGQATGPDASSTGRDLRAGLPDGRTVGYAEYGDPTGRPILYCHGSPGSRLELSLVEDVDRRLAEVGARVIAPDRPGIGLSDPLPGRRFPDWPGDAFALLDHLGVGRVAAWSYSAGSPYALVCAAARPDRVSAVGVVAGVGRPLLDPGARDGMGATRFYWGSARLHPWLTARILSLQARAPGDKLPPQARVGMPDPDWAVVGTPEVWAALLDATFREGCRQGSRWLAEEAVLYLRPWGFDPATVTVPVHVWHGALDRNVPVSHGHHLVGTIPGSTGHLSDGDGHVSILVDRFDEIVATLLTAG